MTLKLFEGYGVELEYAIVDGETLDVRPCADEVLKSASGEIQQELERGSIAWSNELVLHVIELKTNGPASTLDGLAAQFHQSVLELEALLQPLGCVLMPTAMHPWMKPEEMKLWPHGDKDIYKAYDGIFDCRGHGWSNLQSTHLNLPFSNDEEFRCLHAALRFVLPLLPPLAASSPLVEGGLGPSLDNRLEFYRNNQRKIPELAGLIVPEPVYSRAEYEELLNSLYRALEPHDPERILCHEWVNSRGAIARFDRNTIELRVLDLQECPSADLAIISAIVNFLKRVIALPPQSLEEVALLPTEALSELFSQGMKTGLSTSLGAIDYAAILGLEPCSTVGEVWSQLSPSLVRDMPAELVPYWQRLLERGSLAEAITRRVKQGESLKEIYRRLCLCLEQDRSFE